VTIFPSPEKDKEEMTRKRHFFTAAFTLLLVVLLSLATGSAEQVLPGDPEIVSFGTGSIRVRLYTDYFCGPCSRMEPKVEELLSNLIKRKVITLTFIDTPVHKMTPLYARYFLYILNSDRSLKGTLRSRAVLFDAAKDKIEDKDVLEDYLKRNGVRFQEMDVRPLFASLSALIQEDDVRSTPTCVIIRDGKKSVFSGEVEITKALKSLR
jgi:thiol-disulfide isomerase/thioredoxin